MLPILRTQAREAKASDRASVQIYRPFFLAGMLCVLTVGCLLGAIALFGIGRSGTYTSAAWTPYILAHANSQLYGWIGFFVMGFALQQHAPSLARATLFHQLAWGSLALTALAIVLRFVAEPMLQSNREFWLPIGVVSGVLQIVAVGLFIFNIAYTRHRNGAGLVWQRQFVYASISWLMAVSIAEPFVFAHTHQLDRTSSIMFVARWYPALRETQFLGFVAMMIFGVALVKLHSCFGVREPIAALARAGFALWTTGLLVRMIGWLFTFERQFEPGSQAMYFSGGVMIAIAAILLVVASRVFEPLREDLRSHKFVRGSFAWLIIAGLLVIWEPFHLRMIGSDFSHAYTGAIRHAVTVGFISQMILGVGSHVVSRMNDLDEKALTSLCSVFILINVGNSARVSLEIATDFTPAAYAPMGITGFVELSGLAIWVYHVVRPMLVRSPLRVVNG